MPLFATFTTLAQIGKERSKKLNVADKSIVYVSERKDYCIENLPAQDDFNKFVLEDEENNDPNMLNSKFLKSQKLGKVLLVKKFFEKIKNNKSKIELPQETVNASEEVFNKISEGLKES